MTDSADSNRPRRGADVIAPVGGDDTIIASTFSKVTFATDNNVLTYALASARVTFSLGYGRR